MASSTLPHIPGRPSAPLCHTLTHSLSIIRYIHTQVGRFTQNQHSDPEACATYKHPLIECLRLNSKALLERKSSESIYPLAAGLDSNFGQDVRIRHFHGYGVGALFPPVSVKLENVFCLLDFIVVHGWRGGGQQVGGHKDFRAGVTLGEVGTDINRVLMMMTMEAHGQLFVFQWALKGDSTCTVDFGTIELGYQVADALM